MSFSRFVGSLLASSAVAVVLATPAALAQSAPSPAPTASALAEIATVVTSDRQPEPITRSSRPTYIVTRRDIEAQGARTIADALETVPGLNLFHYGPFGAQANYGVLGATSAQTLVLLDGIPIAPASAGQVDLGSYSTLGVNRIEVVESAGSTLYGSSAVGGIINIITAPVRQPYVQLSAGTLGDRDARFEASDGGFGAAFERHIATNTYDYPALDGSPAGTRSGASAAQSAVRFSFNRALGPRWSIDAALGDDYITIGVPGSTAFLDQALQSTSRSDMKVDLTRSTERSALTLTLAGAKESLAYNDSMAGESDTYDARTQVSLRDTVGDDRATLVSGIDLSRQTAALFLGATQMPPTESAALAQSAAYAQYSQRLGSSLRLTGGVRGEHDAPAGSVLIPSLGALATLGTVRLAANASGSFRAPTVDDLYYPGYSNPNLVPERASTVDATATLPTARGSVSLNWFSRNAVNLIALDANYIPQNIARASLAGFVLSARTVAVDNIVATLGVTNTYRAVDRSPGVPQSQLAFEPTFVANVGLERVLAPRGLGFGVNVRVDAAHVENGVLRDGETTVDAFVRARLAAAGGVVTLRGRNLFDERYAPIAGYPAPGRTLQLELSTR